MRRHIRFIILLFAILPTGACSPSSTPVSTSIAQENYPLNVRTGIQIVDSVLDAVASGSPEELLPLIHYTVAPCTTADGLGGPPKCRDGEADGTQMEVLPFISSEGSFIRKSEIGTWQRIEATSVYAIHQIAENLQREEYYPSGEYAIIFITAENQPAVSLHIDKGGIVRVDYLFDPSPESLKLVMERDTSGVILAPKSR